MKFLILAMLFGFAFLAASLAADEEARAPAEGDDAPDFRLNDQTGKALRLSDHAKGSWAVLAFFPKASTPG